MAGLGELVDDIAVRFGLGVKDVRLIMQEVFDLIEFEPDGLDGFLAKIDGVDLEAKEAFWFRRPFFKMLSAAEVRRAVGIDAIRRISQTAGLSEHRAIEVLGYVIPKTIFLLTQSRKLPASLRPAPTSAGAPWEPLGEASFSFESEERAMLSKKVVPHRRMAGGSNGDSRLIVPGAALLLTLGVIGYAVFSGTSSDDSTFTPVGEGRSATAAVDLPARSEEALVENAQSLADELAVKSSGGALNEALSRGHIAPALAFAISRIETFGDAFGGFGGSSSAKLLAGHDHEVAQAGDARAFLLTPLGPSEVKAGKTPQGLRKTASANNPVVVQAETQPAAGPETLAPKTAIDFPVIVFRPDSAWLSSDSRPALRRLAAELKLLPPGTVVELNGYTFGRHNSPGGTALSLRRAEVVREFLIEEGMSPSLLQAKGHGSALLAALANDTLEGRSSTVDRIAASHDRRVEFRLVPEELH
ncbi:MAG TPA: OmpA family protein [Methylocella sp.]|nr:OmpA family protein [Methylocella sp.]